MTLQARRCVAGPASLYRAALVSGIKLLSNYAVSPKRAPVLSPPSALRKLVSSLMDWSRAGARALGLAALDEHCLWAGGTAPRATCTTVSLPEVTVVHCAVGTMKPPSSVVVLAGCGRPVRFCIPCPCPRPRERRRSLSLLLAALQAFRARIRCLPAACLCSVRLLSHHALILPPMRFPPLPMPERNLRDCAPQLPFPTCERGLPAKLVCPGGVHCLRDGKQWNLCMTAQRCCCGALLRCGSALRCCGALLRRATTL